MPIYEYECETCHHQFEVQQKFSDPPVETCGKCGNGVRKLISAPGIMFKGTGWYVTDYSNKLKDPNRTKPSEGSEKTEKDGTKSAEKAESPSTKSESSTTAPPPSASPSSPSSPTPSNPGSSPKPTP